MAPRNLRKKRPADSDDEDEDAGQQTLQERIEDARALIRNRVRAKGVGADALALGDGKADAEPDEPEDAAPQIGLRPGAGAAGAMSGAFSAGAAVHTDGEDPNMLRYVEEELAKRRAGDATTREDARAPTPRDEDSLWDVPANLAATRREDDESAARHMTGIVEVQLPMDYKMRNIEETERAKRAILERARGDEGDAAARGAETSVAARGAHEQRLDRKMFASSFGKGGGPRGDASSRARWREREDERRNAAWAPGGGGGGGGGRGAAAEVASDDLVFKRWMNNEKKRVRR